MKGTEKRIRGPVAIKGQAADDPQMGCMVWMAHRRYFSLTPIPTTVCLTKGKRIKLLPCKVWLGHINTIQQRHAKAHILLRMSSFSHPATQSTFTEKLLNREQSPTCVWMCVCVWVCVCVSACTCSVTPELLKKQTLSFQWGSQSYQWDAMHTGNKENIWWTVKGAMLE